MRFKMRFKLHLFVLSSLALGAMSAGGPAAAQTCENLAGVVLPHATVTAAESVTGGSFTPPGSATPLTDLPPFCRVAVESTPTSDSLIKLEVWIPLGEGWNGRYQQLGCGGFCGSIGYGSLAHALRQGYATAATDDGSTSSGSFALGHPEKIVDFGYRALKETTDSAKTLIAAFAGQGPNHSYFNGCSDGGREALMEAQRFPDDFDGIIVGAPANDWTHLFTGFIWNEQAVNKTPESWIPPNLVALLSQAALAQCSSHDPNVAGDNFLVTPNICHFDPASVQCTAGQDPTTCLSAAQVETARAIYDGPVDPVTGKSIFPGYPPGVEGNPANWPAWITGGAPGFSIQAFFGNGYFSNFVFQDPTWDYRTFDFHNDVAFADNGVDKIISSIDPDLRPFRDQDKHRGWWNFKQRGGKMIQYHGWGDSAISPISSINYYNKVRNVVGPHHGFGGYEEIRDFYRLFLVPGMSHCGGGEGPNAFGNGSSDGPVIDSDHDVLKALERWVEKGVAPKQIIATHYVNNSAANGVQYQRPLCPYPEVPRHIGHGDTSKASSFKCVPDLGHPSF
jgi:Tannase and feruloyl esterase